MAIKNKLESKLPPYSQAIEGLEKKVVIKDLNKEKDLLIKTLESLIPKLKEAADVCKNLQKILSDSKNSMKDSSLIALLKTEESESISDIIETISAKIKELKPFTKISCRERTIQALKCLTSCTKQAFNFIAKKTNNVASLVLIAFIAYESYKYINWEKDSCFVSFSSLSEKCLVSIPFTEKCYLSLPKIESICNYYVSIAQDIVAGSFICYVAKKVGSIFPF